MKPAAQRLIGILSSLTFVIASLFVYSSLLIPKYKDIQNLRGERGALNGLLVEEEEAVVEEAEAGSLAAATLPTIALKSLERALSAKSGVCTASAAAT